MANKVFIIHGRNKHAVNELKKFLRSINITPVTWDCARREIDKTFTSNLEIFESAVSDSTAFIALLTDDDFAALRPALGDEKGRYQPRPNVIFEMGYCLSFAGKGRVIPLSFNSNIEISDIAGININVLNNTHSSRKSLIDDLRSAGCEVDDSSPDHLDPEISGNFEKTEIISLSESSNYYPEINIEIEGSDLKKSDNISIMERGEHDSYVADSTISKDKNLSPLKLSSELETQIAHSNHIDLKHHYIGVTGARNWIELSQYPGYEHNEIVNDIRSSCPEFTDCIDTDNKLDLISLGAGDGRIDEIILAELFRKGKLNYYYCMDISFELLQTAVSHITELPWIKDDVKIKSIYGDFTKLINYKSVYQYESTTKLFSLLGFTFGNYKESELIGKIREGMSKGDYLLFDARLHDIKIPNNDPNRIKEKDKESLGKNYHSIRNNKFAFGSIESVSNLSFDEVKENFRLDICKKFTSIPNSINLITSVKIPEGSAIELRSISKTLEPRRINLAFSTLYEFSSLKDWIFDQGFDLAWESKNESKAFFLVRKI